MLLLKLCQTNSFQTLYYTFLFDFLFPLIFPSTFSTYFLYQITQFLMNKNYHQVNNCKGNNTRRDCVSMPPSLSHNSFVTFVMLGFLYKFSMFLILFTHNRWGSIICSMLMPKLCQTRWGINKMQRHFTTALHHNKMKFDYLKCLSVNK